MQLFSISTIVNGETVNVDFTNNITVPSYKVNDFDIAEEWEDGNKKKHKEIVRSQVKGSFTLKFMDAQSFNHFFEVLNANKVLTGDNSGAVLMNVFVQNKNIVKSIYAFVTADPANTLPYMGAKNYEGFNVQIEEA